jgi:hypothetical protein
LMLLSAATVFEHPCFHLTTHLLMTSHRPPRHMQTAVRELGPILVSEVRSARLVASHMTGCSVGDEESAVQIRWNIVLRAQLSPNVWERSQGGCRMPERAKMPTVEVGSGRPNLFLTRSNYFHVSPTVRKSWDWIPHKKRRRAADSKVPALVPVATT